MTEATPSQALLERAVGLLDLTNLEDSCTDADIVTLCERAQTPVGPVAAVCVWPRFVPLAKRQLAGTSINVATVANFPAGGDDVIIAASEVAACIAYGADEVDIVLPYQAFEVGLYVRVGAVLESAVKQCHDANVTLKVILETGELTDVARVAEASQFAVDQGADFIKTSTGKSPISATLDATDMMLQVIHAASRPVGLKPSGGIRTTEQAMAFLQQAEKAMGEGWATPKTFRFGASSLLNALLNDLGHAKAPAEEGAY